MNTPNIDLLLSDITFRRGWLAKMLEVTVHDGDDTRFDAVSIVDLIHEIRALRQQRDEARRDAERLAKQGRHIIAEFKKLRGDTMDVECVLALAGLDRMLDARTAAITQGDA